MKKIQYKSNTNISPEEIPQRRSFMIYGLKTLATTFVFGKAMAASLSGPKQSSEVQIEKFSTAGKSEGMIKVNKLIKTDEEWRKQLSADEYKVTRREGTEAPYSGKYWNNHDDGIYKCICCNTALFDSKTKYDSRTGWPSFWQPISTINVVKSIDNSLGMQREAVSCRLCDAHLGHVFSDGPKPTGLRYCMNSVSLQFVKKA